MKNRTFSSEICLIGSSARALRGPTSFVPVFKRSYAFFGAILGPQPDLAAFSMFYAFFSTFDRFSGTGQLTLTDALLPFAQEFPRGH